MTLEAVNGGAMYTTPSQPEPETLKVEKAAAMTKPMRTAEIVDITENANKAKKEGATDDSENKAAKNSQIKDAVDKINKQANTEAVFGIHDATNRVTIKIVDKDSKKVIKELPPEETLDMIAKVWELAGLFVDEKR